MYSIYISVMGLTICTDTFFDGVILKYLPLSTWYKSPKLM